MIYLQYCPVPEDTSPNSPTASIGLTTSIDFEVGPGRGGGAAQPERMDPPDAGSDPEDSRLRDGGRLECLALPGMQIRRHARQKLERAICNSPQGAGKTNIPFYPQTT